MAVDKDKIVGYKISTTNGNSNDFLEFLKSLNLQNNTILMDNVAFHKTKIVKEYIESTNSNILFVPPYSPDYNPIEMVFSKLKSVYRKIDDEMYLAVSKALESLQH
jgi:transposase